jgi:hypothetical protein
LLRCALRCCAATHSAATPATRSAAQQRNAQRSVCENVPFKQEKINYTFTLFCPNFAIGLQINAMNKMKMRNCTR